jgi:hypothetical protein
MSPRTIPKLLSTFFNSVFCLKEHKTRPSVPELNFVSESNKGNLQAAQNDPFYGH